MRARTGDIFFKNLYASDRNCSSEITNNFYRPFAQKGRK